MNSKVLMIGICGVLMISVIIIIAQSNTNDKVFAQAGGAANNHSATSKANTAANAASSHTASNAYLNLIGLKGLLQIYKLMKVANQLGSSPARGV
jgi:uncharacterized membrane protein YuzA (DUF378 family)